MTEGTILVVPRAIGSGTVDLGPCMSKVCWVVVLAGKEREEVSGLGHLVVGSSPNQVGHMGGQADGGKGKRLWLIPTDLDVWDILWGKSSPGT